ncbi:hypothetical protein [Noviherbaspirillum sp. ST9]|uniref:hypothetical protein n=1 Tax=Noviherbaspirillum sp. ST9 TaxID=3401606 RepID=UPI003B58B24A
MTNTRPFLLAFLLLLGAAGAHAADDAQDVEWLSYRDAYRQMIRFEKFGKPKHLIQNHLQVSPKDKGGALDGVRLALSGPATQLNLPLDAAGRAVFPFLKSAYDDNARLVLNRKAGQFVLQPRVSIVPRADGAYEIAELRSACEQALDYLRYAGKPVQDRKCAGVRFAFARTGVEPVVKLRGASAALPVEDGSAFPDAAAGAFRIVTYRFAEGTDKGTLLTQGIPAAIAPEFR